MNLEGIQARIHAVNPCYVDMLTWKQQGNKRLGILITAVPKKPLSDLAFNAVKRVFKRLGGKFVSWRGQSWFELVVLEEQPRHSDFGSPQGHGSEPSATSPESGVLKQIEAKVANLRRAGQQLLEEV